jgi:hypothetical protein
MAENVTLWGTWLAAIITLAIYSFLYSDNKVYRVLLNIMVGLNVGYAFIIDWKNMIGPKWWDKLYASTIGLMHGNFDQAGNFIYAFSILALGVLWYFQLSRKYMWLSRIVMGIFIGVGAGAVFKGQFLMNVPQITDSFRPLVSTNPTPLWSNGAPMLSGGVFDCKQTLNNILFVVTIVCVMVYFFFSFSHDRKVIGNTAKVGRWLLMICFGAFFGNTIMTRMAVFLERLQFLIKDWSQQKMYIFGHGIIGILYFLILALLCVIGIYLITSGRPKKPKATETPEMEIAEVNAGEVAG